MRKITQKIERLVIMMAMLWAQEIMSAKTMEEAKALYERYRAGGAYKGMERA